MSDNAGFSCYLLGSRSLAIQCGESILERGNVIRGVMSDDQEVVAWAQGKGLKAAPVKYAKDVVAGQDFDYLFSIVNLQVTDEAVVNAPRIAAINFHDGPLPEYAGLNTTTWAILNDQSEHGVSWHQMLAKVDQGEVYVQSRFPITEDETSFSLNVKCYERGFEAFQALLDKIESGPLTGERQDLSRQTVFYRSDRPELGAWIDWTQPAADIARLVRALNFGAYENPLATPRALLGDRQVIVFNVEDRDQSGAPGQLLEVSADGILVGTGEGSLWVSEIRNALSGDVLGPEAFQVGDQFYLLGQEDRVLLETLVPKIAKKEAKWVRRFQELNEFDSPVRLAGGQEAGRTPAYGVMSLADAVPGTDAATLVALQAAFWCRLGKADRADLPFRLPTIGKSLVSSGYVNTLPLTIDLSADPDASALASQLNAGLNVLAADTGYSSDLFVRYPQLAGVPSGWVTGVHGIAFVVLEEGQPVSGLSAALNIVWERSTGSVNWHVDYARVDAAVASQYLEQFSAFAAGVLGGASARTATLLSARDREQLQTWNETPRDVPAVCVHQLIEQQALKTPDACAVACGDVSLTYAELNRRANQMARVLVERGVSTGDRVGILMSRSEHMVVAMIAAWKAGGSYVPLDPSYPVDRIQYMIGDAGVAAIVTESSIRPQFVADTSVAWILFDKERELIAQAADSNLDLAISPSELAYTIYTSGSTGKPKGVMVEHRNAVNFFIGMDERIECSEPGTWLAVTSISFDISVLELFWTLSRGFKVVVYQDANKALAARSKAGMDFSLFYWNVASEAQEREKDKYRLLMESARFGDANGFKAVWTPERHFAAFGALFPNPAVTSAALATITKNIDIRAGSCVAPLHSPIRIAEDWAVIDNLSKGRVGIAFAAGWAPKDFAIKPETFPTAKATMFEYMDTVRALWKGESRMFPAGKGEVEVTTLPRPIQSDLPVWVTTAGNIDSYLQAADKQAGILTHLLGQTVEEVAEKVAAYRKRWKELGNPGEGHVVLMLHTLIGESNEQVEAIARGPMKEYLRSAMFLVKQAAWNFPIYKKMSEEEGKSLDELFETLSDADYDQVLDFAFERYYGSSGLFGTPDSALDMVRAVKEAGVDEIGCLIDFGMPTDVVLRHLPYLKQLMDKARGMVIEVKRDETPATIGEVFARHDVTHLQCTPSMATMLVNEPGLKPHMEKLKQMMVGGEAMAPQLAKLLAGTVSGRVTNMYGPTETTIWSTTHDVTGSGDVVPIGKPIANTQVFIVDEHLQPLPVGVVGEIVICGKGVVRGYHERPELNEERFVNLEVEGHAYRAYRTGDLGRWLDSGVLQCLGRQDHQVKIRGYRIELGEIEALLRDHPKVLEAAVDVLVERQQLAAFYRVAGNEPPTAKELEDFLSARLPEFMVPAFYKALTVIPQTPNGKIDRKALPKHQLQESAVESKAVFVAPTSDLERQVADIWKQALGVNSVGINDNFFDIGGHSILALRVLQEIRMITDKPLQMTDLFKYTTISAIAAFLSSDDSDDSERNTLKSRGAARKAVMARRKVRRK